MDDPGYISVEEVINSLLFEIHPERILRLDQLYDLFYKFFGLCTYHYRVYPRWYNHQQVFNVSFNSNDFEKVGQYFKEYKLHEFWKDDDDYPETLCAHRNPRPDLSEIFASDNDSLPQTPFDAEQNIFSLVAYINKDFYNRTGESLLIGNYLPLSGLSFNGLKSKFYTDILDLMWEGLANNPAFRSGIFYETEAGLLLKAVTEIEKRLFNTNPEDHLYYLQIQKWFLELRSVMLQQPVTNPFRLKLNHQMVVRLFLELGHHHFLDQKVGTVKDFTNIFCGVQMSDLTIIRPKPKVYWNKPIPTFQHFISKLITIGLAGEPISKAIRDSDYFFHFYNKQWHPINGRKNLPSKIEKLKEEEAESITGQRKRDIEKLDSIILGIKGT